MPRPLLPLLLALPIAALVLHMGACLPVGAGDPETSKVDARFSGAWVEINEDGTDGDVVVLLPFDARAYVLRSVKIDRTKGLAIESEGLYKAWLTTISGVTFLTAQPLYPADLATDGKAPGMFVAALGLSEDGARVEAKAVDPDHEALAPLRTMPGHLSYEPAADGAKPLAEAEAAALMQRVLAAHAKDGKLYSVTVAYRRVTDKALLKALFETVTG